MTDEEEIQINIECLCNMADNKTIANIAIDGYRIAIDTGIDNQVAFEKAVKDVRMMNDSE